MEPRSGKVTIVENVDHARSARKIKFSPFHVERDFLKMAEAFGRAPYANKSAMEVLAEAGDPEVLAQRNARPRFDSDSEDDMREELDSLREFRTHKIDGFPRDKKLYPLAKHKVRFGNQAEVGSLRNLKEPHYVAPRCVEERRANA